MPTYQRATIRSADDIRAVADHAGSHFFSPDTMRFFQSRVLSGVWAPDGHQTVEGRRFFFVTSERYGDDAPRHYAVRMMTLGSQRDDRPAVDIVTVSNYHATRKNANMAAQLSARRPLTHRHDRKVLAMFGIREEESAGKTIPLTVWSGPFCSTFEASGRAVNGARRITLTTYNGDKVVAVLPDGLTFPRTNENYRDIDRSISWALQDHYDERGCVTVGP